MIILHILTSSWRVRVGARNVDRRRVLSEGGKSRQNQFSDRAKGCGKAINRVAESACGTYILSMLVFPARTFHCNIIFNFMQKWEEWKKLKVLFKLQYFVYSCFCFYIEICLGLSEESEASATNFNSFCQVIHVSDGNCDKLNGMPENECNL